MFPNRLTSRWAYNVSSLFPIQILVSHYFVSIRWPFMEISIRLPKEAGCLICVVLDPHKHNFPTSSSLSAAIESSHYKNLSTNAVAIDIHTRTQRQKEATAFTR